MIRNILNRLTHCVHDVCQCLTFTKLGVLLLHCLDENPLVFSAKTATRQSRHAPSCVATLVNYFDMNCC